MYVHVQVDLAYGVCMYICKVQSTMLGLPFLCIDYTFVYVNLLRMRLYKRINNVL